MAAVAVVAEEALVVEEEALVVEEDTCQQRNQEVLPALQERKLHLTSSCVLRR